VFSKIFEEVLYKRLCYHLTINNILVKEQFGFRSNSSTEIAIYTLLNNILSSLNNRIVGGLFCDLQKPFDCVNYEILLSKMKFYGITGIANRLMESYLRNRYQRVNINPVQSYLLMIQALLLQITMRLNLSSKLMRYLMK